MAEDDDMFADLLGPKPQPDPAAAAPPPMRPKPAHTTENGASANGASPAAAAASPRGDLLQQGMYVMLKEDARDYIHEAVKTCVDDAVKGSVGRVVQGLRDVLVSVTKRMEKVETEVRALKDAVASADMESVTLQLNTRFTTVDESLRELARSVQAMRDRAELVDTQSQLSKMQMDSKPPTESKSESKPESKKKKKPVKAPSVYETSTDSDSDEPVVAQRSPPARKSKRESQSSKAPQQQPAPIQTAPPPQAQQPQQMQQPMPTAPPATPMQPYSTAGPFNQPPPSYNQPPPAPPLPSALDPYQSQPRHQYSNSLSSQQAPPPPQYQPSYSQPQPSFSQPSYTQPAPSGGGSSYPAYSAPTAPSGGGFGGYPASTAPSGGYGMGRNYSDSADYAPKCVFCFLCLVPSLRFMVAATLLVNVYQVEAHVRASQSAMCTLHRPHCLFRCAAVTRIRMHCSLSGASIVDIVICRVTRQFWHAPARVNASSAMCSCVRGMCRFGRSSPTVTVAQTAPRAPEPMSRSTQQVISDICAIGFERRRVEAVLSEMLQSGKDIDLNAVVDKLMAEQR